MRKFNLNRVGKNTHGTHTFAMASATLLAIPCFCKHRCVAEIDNTD